MTAVRASISDIVTGTYGDDNGPHITSSYGVELRRVVIVGFVVSKFNKDADSEGGKKFINQTRQVIVTSVLQTAAGRMIFAKPA